MESIKPPAELSGTATAPSHSVEQKLLFPKEQPEHVTVETTFGPVGYAYQGDLKRAAIITWSQAGLNHHQCFRNFLTQPGAERLLDSFCIIHMQAPGLRKGEPPLAQYPTLDVLADMTHEVIVKQNLRGCVLLGSGVGANILLRLALKYPEADIAGMCLFAPSIYKESWSTWTWFQVVATQHMYATDVSESLKDHILATCFSHNTIRTDVDRMNVLSKYMVKSVNVANLIAYLSMAYSRDDISDKLNDKFKPDTLLLCGADSEFLAQAEEINHRLNSARSSCMKVGSLSCSLILEYRCMHMRAQYIVRAYNGLSLWCAWSFSLLL
eukprot:TRINITY_DN8579_c0_g1_i1.p1 TRINITY_DN8579_c0_g1~~TRINITY_DN8579_c0_g1_i1.p1  ORF type:complete len:344 (+),score=54.76 TRINITY_DN8579_c0_g1_i1:60-1034(+)